MGKTIFVLPAYPTVIIENVKLDLVFLPDVPGFQEVS